MKQLTTLTFLCVLIFGTASADAQLLVGDRTSNQITKYDATTGEFLGVLVDVDPAEIGGPLTPSSMTFGPNGDLLIASQFTGSVLRFDPDSGDFLGVYADQINGPSGLLYREQQDELLVSTFGNFDAELILRYRASTGELLGAIGEGTGPTGRTAMALGPDGDLYVGSFADPQFFLGSVLEFDGDTLASNGVFAALFPMGEEDPFLAGANGLTFREGAEAGTYQLDVVGLFSNNVARFDVGSTEEGLQVQSAGVVIAAELDFPSALLDLGDGSMLVTSLGNDNPATGDLRPGSIGQFDVASGEFLGTFVAAGGEGNLTQPTVLLLLNDGSTFDCNGDGVVDAGDLDCACAADVRDELLAELNLAEGDLDGDGEVAFADFLVLSENFSQAGDYASGDIDCNGTVEFADFLVLSENFGQMSNASQVPEPSGILLAFATVLGLSLSRKRR